MVEYDLDKLLLIIEVKIDDVANRKSISVKDGVEELYTIVYLLTKAIKQLQRDMEKSS